MFHAILLDTVGFYATMSAIREDAASTVGSANG
jgi:hypothetical protein